MRFGLGVLERTQRKIKNSLETTRPDINLVAIQEQSAQAKVLGTNTVHFLCNCRARTPYRSSTQHYAQPLPPSRINRATIPTDTKFICIKYHLQPVATSIIFVLY